MKLSLQNYLQKSLSITFDVKGVDFDKSYKAETVGLAKGKTIKKSGVTYKVTTAATYIRRNRQENDRKSSGNRI